MSTTIKCKFDATVAPTATDDSTGGWGIGSRWTGTTLGQEYVCVDPTENAAVWKLSTASTPSQVGAVSKTPSATSIDDTDSPYSVLAADEIVLADTTTDAVSVVLPATGSLKNIKWVSGTNTLTVTVTGGGTIDGSASFVFNTSYLVGTSITCANASSGIWVIV